ncbi:RNA polymerase sigma factor [Microbacterium sp. ZW T5_56]|uniref:RNA polymerase sigma factor n=1 Tax=Microbacterium sp. ZW T5_56 TaxID=3378081 RepID=UPI0038520446
MSDELQTDRDLIQAARQGDQSACAELWERHRRPGYVAARSQTSVLDPEDVVSEAFVRVFRMLAEGGGPDRSFRPYLYQVIRTVIRDELRPSETELDESTADVAVDAFDVESAFDRDMARRAFEQVPEKYRPVLWQVEIEGRSPRDAAKLLGMTPNHVSALRVRGRRALRRAWIEVQVSSIRSTDACDEFAILLVREATEPIAASQAARLQAHLHSCRSCRKASDEAHSLADMIGGRVLPLIIACGAGVGAAMPWGETAAAAATVAGAGTTALASTASAPAALASGVKAVGVATFAPKAIAAVVASVVVVGGGAGVWNVVTSNQGSGDDVVAAAVVLVEPAAPVSPTAAIPAPVPEVVPTPVATEEPVIEEISDPIQPEPSSPPPVVEPEPAPPVPTPVPTPTTEPVRMTAPEVTGACAARISDTEFSIQGAASGAGTVQVAPTQGDTSSFVSAAVDDSDPYRWATDPVTLTATGVSFRGVAPDGTVGSWVSVSVQVC